jgi:hypothetical protein
MKLDLQLATGDRTRRVHLIGVLDTSGVAICNGMTVKDCVPTDPFLTMVSQVTCANCIRQLHSLARQAER